MGRVGETVSRFDKQLKAITGIIASLGVLGGLVVGAVQIGISPVTDKLSALEQSTTRSELLLLINNYPDDRRAIEELAYHYFAELKGDSYVYLLYANWASAHNVDYSHITELHQLSH